MAGQERDRTEDSGGEERRKRKRKMKGRMQTQPFEKPSMAALMEVWDSSLFYTGTLALHKRRRERERERVW